MTYCASNVPALVVVQRVRLLPLLDLREPLRGVARAPAACSAPRAPRGASPTMAQSMVNSLLISAGSMSTWIFTASGQNVSGVPVIRSSQREPDRHDQVAVRHRLVGVGGAVHAEHAQGQRVGLGERALAQQGVGHGDLHRLGERAQLRAGARDHRPVARRAARAASPRAACRAAQAICAGSPVGGNLVAGEMELVVVARLDRSRWSSPWGCR